MGIKELCRKNKIHTLRYMSYMDCSNLTAKESELRFSDIGNAKSNNDTIALNGVANGI